MHISFLMVTAVCRIKYLVIALFFCLPMDIFKPCLCLCLSVFVFLSPSPSPSLCSPYSCLCPNVPVPSPSPSPSLCSPYSCLCPNVPVPVPIPVSVLVSLCLLLHACPSSKCQISKYNFLLSKMSINLSSNLSRLWQAPFHSSCSEWPGCSSSFMALAGVPPCEGLPYLWRVLDPGEFCDHCCPLRVPQPPSEWIHSCSW